MRGWCCWWAVLTVRPLVLCIVGDGERGRHRNMVGILDDAMTGHRPTFERSLTGIHTCEMTRHALRNCSMWRMRGRG